EAHAARALLLVHIHAARVIQRQWRRYRQKIEDERRRRALMVISRIFAGYVHRRRVIAQHRAGNTIRQFFKDVHDVSKLMRIVKKYRFEVVKAQTFSRSWLAIHRARLHALSLYWDTFEPKWWAQRKASSGPGFAASAAVALGL
ncbi:hypothetical protein HK102_012742, partial [Quaeritorhiza haematococci]